MAGVDPSLTGAVRYVCVSDLHLGVANSVLTGLSEDHRRTVPHQASAPLKALAQAPDPHGVIGAAAPIEEVEERAQPYGPLPEAPEGNPPQPAPGHDEPSEGPPEAAALPRPPQPADRWERIEYGLADDDRP